MIRNEDFLELRESYIEIGKMVQKYGYGGTLPTDNEYDIQSLGL